ncbi:hypothetical protein HBH61_024500 [Parastagonospora nodorum]|nr:hypothetical protein HBH61_024500 [Parastagonospora nodorum]KAH5226436.1 hypothetical protein HBH68_023950 [Parastagonospora nodorum]KAH5742578.1 hypothetical protein HBI17_163920 [Parastagonospora nodorum]
MRAEIIQASSREIQNSSNVDFFRAEIDEAREELEEALTREYLPKLQVGHLLPTPPPDMSLLLRHEPGEAPLQLRNEEISIAMLSVGLYASTHFIARHLLRPP